MPIILNHINPIFMKSKLLFLLCISFIMIYGCSKENTESGKLPDAKTVALNALQNATSTDARTQIYLGMSAAERYALWKDHFSVWKDSPVLKNNPAKLQLVQELENSLNVEIFADSSEAQTVFLNYTFQNWLYFASQLFTDDELFELTMQNIVVPVQSNIVDNLPDCFCHVGNTGYKCKKVSVGFPLVFQVDYGMCELATPCDASRLGCGAFWLESCNGAHCNF